MLWVVLICFLGVVSGESHFADYIGDCNSLRVKQSITLFNKPNENGKLNIIMNSLSDSFRAMNVVPQISYVTCGVEIAITPSFVQFNEAGEVIRFLDPNNPPKEIKTEADIFGYFVESSLSSRINKAIRVDFTTRTSLVHLHDLKKHNEFILAVLPKEGYNKHLAEYVEWVQEQEYGIFEFQYTQEHHNDLTSVFLSSIGHFQSKLISLSRPKYYYIKKQEHGGINTWQFDSLGELKQSTICFDVCKHDHCQTSQRNTVENCGFGGYRAYFVYRHCTEDINCNGRLSNSYSSSSNPSDTNRRKLFSRERFQKYQLVHIPDH